MAPTQQAFKRISLVVWDWNSGLNTLPPEGFDEWGAEGISDLLVRVDKRSSADALQFLSERIAAYLPEAQVLVFLHGNEASHGYTTDTRRKIFERVSQMEPERLRLGRLKINLFGGGGIPIYYEPDKPQCRGFLGSKGNFPRVFQNPDTGKKREVSVVVSEEQRLLIPDVFHHVWTNYWVGTRQKVYSLMENFRYRTDDFDPANYKVFTQYLRNEKGLMWQQLVYFTQNKIELKSLPAVPTHEWADFRFCEQQIELAYGSALVDQYRDARRSVERLALEKSYQTPEEVEAGRTEIYNLLDALQSAIPEALSYDTVARVPR